jgi:hypothetical protein
MQESQTRGTVKKDHASGTRVETVVGRLPRSEGAAGHLALCGGLTLGEAVGLQREIRIKAFSAFHAIPAWLGCLMALVPGLDEGFHSALLVHPLSWYGHGSGWRGRRRIATLR